MASTNNWIHMTYYRLFTFPGIHLAFTKQQPLQQALSHSPGPRGGLCSGAVGEDQETPAEPGNMYPNSNQRQLPARLSWMEVLVWMENHRTKMGGFSIAAFDYHWVYYS